MIIALFDSGVDPTHVTVAARGAPAFERVAGLAPSRLRRILERAVRGAVTEDEISELEGAAVQAEWNAGLPPSLLPGWDFAGHYPRPDSRDYARSPSRNVFDYNGHGTPAAGILIGAGHVVLPLKVAYSMSPQVSLDGLEAACRWLVKAKAGGLSCERALWPFGVPGTELEPFFADLAARLQAAGVDVIASGRGVFHNLTAAGDTQVPSDLDGVTAVDERLILRRIELTTDNAAVTGSFALLPACPAPPVGTSIDGVLLASPPQDLPDAPTCQAYRVRICAAKELAEHGERVADGADALVIVDSPWPYVMHPLPYVFDIPVLVECDTASSVSGLAVDGAGPVKLRFTDRGNLDLKAEQRSRSPRSWGITGVPVAAAHTRTKLTSGFGSSLAAPYAAAYRAT